MKPITEIHPVNLSNDSHNFFSKYIYSFNLYYIVNIYVRFFYIKHTLMILTKQNPPLQTCQAVYGIFKVAYKASNRLLFLWATEISYDL